MSWVLLISLFHRWGKEEQKLSPNSHPVLGKWKVWDSRKLGEKVPNGKECRKRRRCWKEFTFFVEVAVWVLGERALKVICPLGFLPQLWLSLESSQQAIPTGSTGQSGLWVPPSGRKGKATACSPVTQVKIRRHTRICGQQREEQPHRPAEWEFKSISVNKHGHQRGDGWGG